MIACVEINVAKAVRVNESVYSGLWCIAKASSFVVLTGNILRVSKVKLPSSPLCCMNPRFQLEPYPLSRFRLHKSTIFRFLQRLY
jgi:hypothetical protein